MNNDWYQKRYVAHQERKKRQLMYSEGERAAMYPTILAKSLATILKRRRSQRVFNRKPLDDRTLQRILDAAILSPNSCNRHGIKLRVVSERKDKELLGGILVGGVGWLHRADKVVLFLADPSAYKSPNEREFMHYCDVGFKAMSMWLTAETLNIGACYINPNVSHKDIFKLRYGDYVFCGALALGYYDRNSRATEAERATPDDIIL